jgi:opacity protein-like surface antigen
MTKLWIGLVGVAVLSFSSGALAADKKRAKPQPVEADEKAQNADDEEPAQEESGFAIGGRLGYALPMGSLAKDQGLGSNNSLSHWASGMVPIIADIGYRINKHIYVGGYFQFAFLTTSGDLCSGSNGCSSSGNDLRFGGSFRYNFAPDARFDPYIGGGFGYEILNLSRSAGSNTENYTARGFEFLNVQLGGDFHVTPEFVIGPMVMMSVGQFGSYDHSQNNGGSESGDFNQTALHQWLMFGARAEYRP